MMGDVMVISVMFQGDLFQVPVNLIGELRENRWSFGCFGLTTAPYRPSSDGLYIGNHPHGCMITAIFRYRNSVRIQLLQLTE